MSIHLAVEDMCPRNHARLIPGCNLVPETSTEFHNVNLEGWFSRQSGPKAEFAGNLHSLPIHVSLFPNYGQDHGHNVQ